MNVLALIHEAPPCSGVFAEAAEQRGDSVEEWSFAWGRAMPRPLEEYGAVWIFGGVMNTHEEEDHPWLVDETRLIQGLLERQVPTLGVCLGGQLIAKAAGARVGPASAPEIGFHEIALTADAAADPLFGSLPARIAALQWHYYSFEVPAGAVTLAENAVCPQAFRLGNAWGVQFHAETTHADWLRWVEQWDAIPDVDRNGFEPGLLRAQAERSMPAWNELGRRVAGRFLELAARGAA